MFTEAGISNIFLYIFVSSFLNIILYNILFVLIIIESKINPENIKSFLKKRDYLLILFKKDLSENIKRLSKIDFKELERGKNFIIMFVILLYLVPINTILNDENLVNRLTNVIFLIIHSILFYNSWRFGHSLKSKAQNDQSPTD